MTIFGYVDSEVSPGSLESFRELSASTGNSEALYRFHAGTSHAFGASVGSGRLGHSEKDEITVALEGQPRWIERALEERAASKDKIYGVVEAYLRYGANLLGAIRGAFSFALFDAKRGRGFLAVDRFGTKPIYYAISNSKLLFGTRLREVLAQDGVADTLDSQALFNYLYFHVVPAPRTIYKAIRRLAPGSFLLFDSGRAKEVRYWEPNFTGDLVNTPGLQEELKALLRESVKRSINGAATGAFLSGGLDSSTLAGMLGAVTGNPARTFTIGFDAEGYDETSYARAVARHFKTDHHEYYVTAEDVVHAVPRVAAHYDQPFGNASAVPVYYCARVARTDGITRLLAGDGGDEIFGGNYRYAKQIMFAQYSRLPTGLRKHVIEPLLFRIPLGKQIAPIRKARSYVCQANVPLPARLETYNLLMRCGVRTVLTSDFLLEVNMEEPIQLVQSIYDSSQGTGMINNILSLDLRITLGDSDLPKVNGMCELAGIDVAYPMLDEDLVAFALSLPESYKVNGLKLRYFFKRAMSDFLPKEVLKKPKHGFGLPFGIWLQNHSALRSLARDSLECLKSRGIVRPEFIDRILYKDHPKHGAYFGTMIWVLMMLEQWYATRPHG